VAQQGVSGSPLLPFFRGWLTIKRGAEILGLGFSVGGAMISALGVDVFTLGERSSKTKPTPGFVFIIIIKSAPLELEINTGAERSIAHTQREPSTEYGT